MSSFQDRILFIRNHNHLTQGEMAERIKLTRAHISNLETGKRSPSDIIITMLCNEFSVSENWLRTGEGEPFFNASHALQRTFASYFIQITKAFAPVFSAYGEIMPLFESKEVTCIYNYIALRVKKGGMNERNLKALAQSFDLAFPGYADVIKALEAQAALTIENIDSSRIARSISITVPSISAALPESQELHYKHVEGKAAAGPPINSIPDTESLISVPAKYLSERYFIVQAQGDSMIDDQINDGDYCVFQKDAFFDEGRIMLVQVDGSSDAPDVTIKRVHRRGDKIELRSANVKYPPMIYAAEYVQLMGVLVDVISNGKDVV